MNEIWKDIPNYEGLYQASNLGKIKSKERMVWNGCKYYKKEERILKPTKDKDGYLIVVLCKNGKSKAYRLHVIIAKIFIPNPLKKPEVNHRDANKKNNAVSNLEWATRNENQKHACEMGLARITKIIQYDLEGNYIKDWGSIAQAVRKLKIDQSSISQVCKGKRKTAGGYIWRYADE